MSKTLLIGASLIALSTGPAEAQVQVVGTNKSTFVNTGSGNTSSAENAFDGNDDNIMSVAQSGNVNHALIQQIGDANQAGSDQLSSNNLSSVVQRGTRNIGLVTQLEGSANEGLINQDAVGDNRVAVITQRGTANKGTIIDNGGANEVTIVQGIQSILSANAFGAVSFEAGSINNKVTAYMVEGSASAHNVLGARINAVGSSVFASIRGYDNVADLTLTGSGHTADVSVLGGGTKAGSAIDAESGKTQGNRVTLKQSGQGHSAYYSIGSFDPTRGQGNWSEINQNGSKHLTLLWQRGFYEKTTIEQGDSLNATSKSDPRRAIADVSQNSVRGNVSIKQVGYSFAQVTQGFGSRSEVTVRQEEPVGLVNEAGMTALIAQNGNSNRAVTAQEAVDSKIILWQRVGSSMSRANVVQGLEYTDTLGTFRGARAVKADVTQSGEWNVADVWQHGSDNVTKIVQLGSGTESLPNKVRVLQRNSTNEASVLQDVTAGPSGADGPSSGAGEVFGFSGGARSAEIFILQRGTNSLAVVDQKGRGQVAYIFQDGDNNHASIFQGQDATNATGSIIQSGSGNTYAITQSRAGQYMDVVQSGTNNSITDVIKHGM